MAPRYRIDLSWGGGLSARDLPWSRSELSAVAQATLQAVRSEARVRAAAERLGPALERLSLLVCSDEEMRNFQKSFRRVDRSTDVLSFPTLELPAAELDLIPKAELSLGDLVVSLPAVVRGARRGRRSLRLEFLEVLIHGILHLLGFDHVTSNRGVSAREAQKMRKIQKELFLKLKAPIKS